MLSRRRLIREAARSWGLGVLGSWGPERFGSWGPGADSALAHLAAQTPCADAAAAGELVRTLTLYGDRPRTTPFGELVGGPGLDARLFTDLSNISPDHLVTPSDQVFVRTAAPPLLNQSATANRTAIVNQSPTADPAARWSVRLTGMASTATALSIDTLRQQSRPMGTHLIECSGNNDPNNFGLMSVAEWDGVPLSEVVEVANPGVAVAGVLVSGLDDETRESWRSVPGASWILPVDALRSTGAFLATRMNGAPLTPDHGAPVRLVVPGWYACAWIKWVQEVRVVGVDEPVTSQMTEFARRTHQSGTPALALDYEAPVIDLAATPVRVEQRRLAGRLHYRIVGIAWGNASSTTPLEVRVSARSPWQPVQRCPTAGGSASWSLWEYVWRPEASGVYDIALRCPDATLRTRRLDLFFYTRRVRID